MAESVKKALEQLSRQERVGRASPTKDDLRREIPSAVITDNADGTWKATVSGNENLKRWAAMNGEANKLKIEQGAERNASIPSERLRDPATGEVREYPAARAEVAAKRRGLRPHINWGRPSYRLTESEIKELLKRERDAEHGQA